MPEVVRHGDRARRGGSVIVEQPLAHSEQQRDARVGDRFACIKHPGPPEHRLLNGCWFNRVEGKPVAIAFVTKASCGCRIVTGSTIYRCCKHLDAKARRLAEREALIEGAREMAKQEWCEPGLGKLINENADRLERLNQDVRYADASVAVYGDATDPRFTLGHGNTPGDANSPEGMIRLSDPRFRENLPESLRNGKLWNNPNSGLQAALYYDELSGQYILAFRGTEGLSDNGDLVSNALQVHGLTAPQYTQAMRLGRSIAENPEPFMSTAPGGQQRPDMHFTGHSLGGGLASTAAAIANRRFTTFNGAGIHANTLPRFTEGARSNSDADPLGRRYFSEKDPLSYAQTEQGSQQAYASLIAIPFFREIAERSAQLTGGRLPRALGNEVFEVPNHAWRTPEDIRLNRTRDAGWSGGHSMMTVVQGIESEKDEAIRNLQNATRAAHYNLLKRANPQLRDADLRWVYEQPVWESW